MAESDQESAIDRADSGWARYASGDIQPPSFVERVKVHRRVLIGLAVLLVLAAVGYWVLRPTTEWVVSAAVDDPNAIGDACGDLSGIQEQSFSMQSDGAKEPPGGVEWTVAGRRNADAVAACFERNGAVSVVISKRGAAEDKTFDNTGP